MDNARLISEEPHLSRRIAQDGKSIYDARADAQKLAFGPIAFHAAVAVRDLGILEALADAGAAGLIPERVAEMTKLPLYGVKVLLEAGLVTAMVTLENGSYRLTGTGLLTLRDTLTRANMDFVADVCYRGMAHLKEAVRTGTPAGLKELGPWSTVYEGLSHLPENVQRSWFTFDHYYSDGLFPNALPIVFAALPRRLLDIGGNTGRFSLACARHNSLVHVALLDLPGQAAMAKENVRAAGFADRITCHDIDFLDPAQEFPGEQDAIWMSQFLDCFSEEQIVSILERARRALAPNGRIHIVDLYWDRQKHAAARFCLVMTSLYFTCLANGNSKMYHSDDMRACVRRAGLEVEKEV